MWDVSSREPCPKLDLTDGVAHGVGLERVSDNFPRGTWYDLSGRQLVRGDQAPDTRGADAQTRRRVLERQPTVARTIGIEGRQGMIVTRRADTEFRPRIPCPRLQPQAIEGGGDLFVRKLSRHLAHNINGVETGTSSVTPQLILLHAEFGMPPTRPMNEQRDHPLRLIDVCHDFLNQETYDSLLEAHVCRGGSPDRWQILGEAHEHCAVWHKRHGTRLIVGVQLLLEPPRVLQGAIPSRFQFRRDEPVVGIDRLIPPCRESRLVLGLLDFQRQGLSLLISLAPQLVCRGDGGLDGIAANRLQDGIGDGGIDLQAAEGDALPLPVIDVRPHAEVTAAPSRRGPRM